MNPETLLVLAEWDPNNPLYSASASLALGISPDIAAALAIAAEDTLLAGAPAAPEPSTWSMMILGFGVIGFMAYRRRKALLVAV